MGITGLPGSGKSLFTRMLEKRGAFVIDADAVAKEIVENSTELLNQLAAAFGDDIMDAQRVLRRAVLAERAFKSPQTKNLLNSLVWPCLIKELKKIINKASAKHEAVCVEMAVLFEAEAENLFDMVVTVEAAPEIREQRLRTQRGWSSGDTAARNSAQLSAAAKRERADLVIYNTGTAADLEKKAADIYNRYFPR